MSGGTIEAEFAENFLGREKDYDIIIAADRGLSFCRRTEIEPDVILGDFDSADASDLDFYRKRFPERILTFPAEKDETDTELAVWEAAKAGCDEITVLGATGTRLDHVLGNIHLLKQALERGIRMYLVDSHNRIRMLRGGETLTLEKKEQFGKYVSLIPFTPQVTGLSLTGFAYNVSGFTLESGCSLGVSNQLADGPGRITLEEGLLLVIESADRAAGCEAFGGAHDEEK